MTAEGPPEFPIGQDDPPDIHMALVVVLILLRDLRDHLAATDPRDPQDLILRIRAVSAVLRRIRDQL